MSDLDLALLRQQVWLLERQLEEEKEKLQAEIRAHQLTQVMLQAAQAGQQRLLSWLEDQRASTSP